MWWNVVEQYLSFPLRVSCGPARCLPVRPGRDVICWFRFKKGIFLTGPITQSAVNAAELLPLVVRATLVAYIAAKNRRLIGLSEL